MVLAIGGGWFHGRPLYLACLNIMLMVCGNGKLSLAGIGGVLLDEKRDVLCLFSKGVVEILMRRRW